MKNLPKLCLLAACLPALPQPAQAYAVLTHEAIVDSLWDGPFTAALLSRFPQTTPAALQQAHAFAYGGSIVQDLGYYPFGSHFFSDLLHYVRSADFLQAMLDQSQNVDEYAFALGAVSHYWADAEGHSLAVNPTVPLLYPKLQRKFGSIVTYGDDPSSHIKTEFAFDVLQVARGHYAPNSYHGFIGFQVSKDLIQSAFEKTYGIPLKSIYGNFDLSVATYRYSVSTVIPAVTAAAWSAKRKEIAQRQPGASRTQFLYNLRRASFQQEWGSEYRKPGLGARFLALLFRCLPKAGPLRGLGFRVPPPASERLFETSFDAAVARDREAFRQAGAGTLNMLNRDLDTGKRASLGEYDLTDKTYDKLLAMLATANAFPSMSPDLRGNILAFYGNMKTADRHGMNPLVNKLKSQARTQ